MWKALNNSDYTAKHIGIRMKFYYKQEFQCELEIRTYAQAKKMLADWARLKLPPAQIKAYQELVKNYVGATVDDVKIGRDGKYYINGKSVDEI